MNDEKPRQPGSRRGFLQGAGAGIGALVLGRGRVTYAAAALVSAPSAFEAGTTSALIRVHATEAMRARIDFSAEASLNQARQGPAVALDKAGDFAATVRLDGLTPGQT